MTESMQNEPLKKRRFPVATLVTVLVLAGVGAFMVLGKAPEANADAKNAADAKVEKKEEEKKAPIPVQIAEVGRGKVSSYLSATANLVPENEVRVVAEWEGRLSKLNIEEGQFISKGQVLAELVRGDAEILQAKAKVRAENAKAALERAERLKAQDLISAESLEKLTMESRVADQEMAEAQWRIDKTYIRSPFSGVVTMRSVQPGQHIRPGDELCVVADFDPLIARIFLPEKDVLNLQPGREVRIALRADDAVSFRGRIQQISPVVDTGTGTVKVTVEAVEPPSQVRPGAFVRVDIVKNAKEGALLVPREAVVRELQNTYVFVAQDGVAHKKAVTLGLEENGKVEVTGIQMGEQVVISGQGGLKDGTAVKLLPKVS